MSKKPTAAAKKKTEESAKVEQLSAAGFSGAQIQALMAVFKG